MASLGELVQKSCGLQEKNEHNDGQKKFHHDRIKAFASIHSTATFNFFKDPGGFHDPTDEYR